MCSEWVRHLECGCRYHITYGDVLEWCDVHDPEHRQLKIPPLGEVWRSMRCVADQRGAVAQYAIMWFSGRKCDRWELLRGFEKTDYQMALDTFERLCGVMRPGMLVFIDPKGRLLRVQSVQTGKEEEAMRRFCDIVDELRRHCPEDADDLTRAWLAAHSAHRHLADIRETAACIESLTPNVLAIRPAMLWLLTELRRHVDAVHDAVLGLLPKDAPADVDWEREDKAGFKDK